MPNLTATQILDIAEGLHPTPCHDDDDLDAAAAQLGVEFPPTFRRLMLQTGGRFAKHETRFLTLDAIADETHAAIEIVTHDFDFSLPANVVVFQWSDIYAFSYFSAIGTDDVPVYEFNYNSGTQPVLISDSVPKGLALCLRQLLELG